MTALRQQNRISFLLTVENTAHIGMCRAIQSHRRAMVDRHDLAEFSAIYQLLKLPEIRMITKHMTYSHRKSAAIRLFSYSPALLESLRYRLLKLNMIAMIKRKHSRAEMCVLRSAYQHSVSLYRIKKKRIYITEALR